MRRALDLVRRILRREPTREPIRCSNCGESAVEGLGDPGVERVCMACAIMFQVRCTDGDATACAHLKELNALARRYQAGGAS